MTEEGTGLAGGGGGDGGGGRPGGLALGARVLVRLGVAAPQHWPGRIARSREAGGRRAQFRRFVRAAARGSPAEQYCVRLAAQQLTVWFGAERVSPLTLALADAPPLDPASTDAEGQRIALELALEALRHEASRRAPSTRHVPARLVREAMREPSVGESTVGASSAPEGSAREGSAPAYSVGESSVAASERRSAEEWLESALAEVGPPSPGTGGPRPAPGKTEDDFCAGEPPQTASPGAGVAGDSEAERFASPPVELGALQDPAGSYREPIAELEAPAAQPRRLVDTDLLMQLKPESGEVVRGDVARGADALAESFVSGECGERTTQGSDARPSQPVVPVVKPEEIVNNEMHVDGVSSACPKSQPEHQEAEEEGGLPVLQDGATVTQQDAPAVPPEIRSPDRAKEEPMEESNDLFGRDDGAFSRQQDAPVVPPKTQSRGLAGEKALGEASSATSPGEEAPAGDEEERRMPPQAGAAQIGVGALVVVKHGWHAPWPAYVERSNARRTYWQWWVGNADGTVEVYVRFLGDQSCAFVPVTNVFLYGNGAWDKFRSPTSHPQYRRQRRAFQLAQAEFARSGGLPREPAATPPHEFLLGDLVMGRVPGFSHWPCIVGHCKWTGTAYEGRWRLADPVRYWCNFPSDNSGQWIEALDMEPFEPKTARKHITPRRRALKKAIAEMTKTYREIMSGNHDDL